MHTPDQNAILASGEVIPDPEIIRRRLAVAATEVDLLRQQLKVSVRHAEERDRLRQLLAGDPAATS
jgi:hypothetical protein